MNDIKASISGEPTLVIFDDFIGSSSLKGIGDLFTVDARHMNMSLVCLTQRLFVNEETFRQIFQSYEYFVIFTNPRNISEIKALAQHMTPGNLILVYIYMEAKKLPFSYLFINMTQKCEPNVKFFSNLFYNLHSYVPDWKSGQEALMEEYTNNNLQPYVKNYLISSNTQTPYHFKRETEPITNSMYYQKDTQTDPVNMSSNYSNT